MDDFDIPQNKLAESAERVVDRALDEARRRDHVHLTNEHFAWRSRRSSGTCSAQVMRDLSLNPHEILQALEEHLRLLPSVPGTRSARRAVDQAAVQAGAAARQPLRAPCRSRPPTCSRRSSRKPRASRSRSSAATASSRKPSCRGWRRACATTSCATSGCKQAFRAAAVPQALRDQPEPARAPGQAAAGLRPRRRDGSGARDPLPPRARELGAAARRAGRRQDRDRRGPGAPDRVRAGEGPGPPARLPDREPADERDGRRHHAARHVRGSDPERHPRDQGTAEPRFCSSTKSTR